MKVFEHFNQSGNDKCPICETADDKQTVLIGIQGTQRDGIMEAKQVHLDCIELIMSDKSNEYKWFIYQAVK